MENHTKSWEWEFANKQVNFAEFKPSAQGYSIDESITKSNQPAVNKCISPCQHSHFPAPTVEHKEWVYMNIRTWHSIYYCQNGPINHPNPIVLRHHQTHTLRNRCYLLETRVCFAAKEQQQLDAHTSRHSISLWHRIHVHHRRFIASSCHLGYDEEYHILAGLPDFTVITDHHPLLAILNIYL